MTFKPDTAARVPEWDGVRGLAILMVVLHHYGNIKPGMGGVAGVIGSVTSILWTGVDLFFVLSGFLLGGILMRYRDSANYFKTFYVRRVCRILPLYFLWMALFFIVPLFAPQNPPGWFLSIFQQNIPHFPNWVYLFFLQNIFLAKTGYALAQWLGPTWSLAIEEQFYLVIPFIIWLVPRRRLLAVLVAMIALVPVFRLYLFLFHSSIFTYVLLPCRADSLLLGVLCAYVLQDEGIRARMAQHRNWIRAAFVVLTAGMVGLTIFSHQRGNATLYTFEMATFGFSWIALFCACLILLVATSRAGVIARLTRVPLLRHFGLIAYAMFLINLPVYTFVQGMFSGKSLPDLGNFKDVLCALAAFLVTWILAVLSWNYFEKPIVRWGHSFAYAPKQIVPVVQNVPTATVP
jgi:peptidoglycan/LPS O-acetylase OafA/YrhL